MMWAKKIAAGVLAAALSLTLLSGCSGGRSGSGSVISEGETISFDTSASYRLNQREGKDADGNVIQPGLYTVNYENKTYKEGGTFGSVEKVLAATIFCNYENEAGTLREVRAASGTKNKQEYYVEVLKFDFGTAAVFYTKDPWKANAPTETDLAALKYIEVYLPGETAAKATFQVKATWSGTYEDTTHSGVTKLHKVTE